MEKILVTKAQGKLIDNVLKKVKKIALNHVYHTNNLLYITDGRMAVKITIREHAEKPRVYRLYKNEMLDKSATELSLEEQPDVQYPDIVSCMSTDERDSELLKENFSIDNKQQLSSVLASCACQKDNYCLSLELIECFYNLKLNFDKLILWKTKMGNVSVYELTAANTQIICLPLLINK